jgi:stalled ribosome alternative rescue factor ArfA
MAIEAFKSLYIKSTKIDLSTHLETQAANLVCKNKELHDRVQALISEPLFRNHFLERPARGRGHNNRLKRQLARKNWQQFNRSTFGHTDLPGWIIRTNHGNECLESQRGLSPRPSAGEFENLQRPIMGDILRRAAKEAKLDLVVPEEYLIQTPNPRGQDLGQRFFVISQKFELEEDQLGCWKALYDAGTLRETVRKICRWISLSGFANASLDNLRFLQSAPGQAKRLAVINTESFGLLEEPGETRELLPTFRRRICALTGLRQFRESWDTFLETDAKREGGDKNISIYLNRYAQHKPLITLVQETCSFAMPDDHSSAFFASLKRVHAVSTTWNWPLIIATIILPLILLILAIAAIIRSASPSRCQA